MHSIESMPVPRSKWEETEDDNEQMVTSMISELPNTFRELLYLTQKRCLSTSDSGYDPRSPTASTPSYLSALPKHNDHDPYSGMSARSRRVAVYRETVPKPSCLEMHILKEHENRKKQKKKKKMAVTLKSLKYSQIDIELDSYKHIEYAASALIHGHDAHRDDDDLILHILDGDIDIDMLSELDAVSMNKYIPLILRSVSERGNYKMLGMLLEVF